MRGSGFSESAGTGYGKKTFVLIDAFSHLCDKNSLVCKNILIPECSLIGKGIAVSRIIQIFQLIIHRKRKIA